MKIILAAVFILLTACSGPQKKFPESANIKDWQKHQQQVKHITQWDIQGRVALSTSQNGGHADVFWQQKNNQHYAIKLVAPLGSGTTFIQASDGAVMLTTSSGESIVETDIDALLSRIDDIQFPVTGLRYWILGVPAPTSEPDDMQWNEQGRLQLLKQDGWRVRMKSYTQVAGYQLPQKIFLDRIDDEDVDVRLVIRQWGIE